MRQAVFWGALVGAVSIIATACSPPEVVIRPGAGGSSAGGDNAGADGGDNSGGDLFNLTGGSGVGGMGAPCAGFPCDIDQHCELIDDSAICVNNECSDIVCSATEVCELTGPNGGAICVDIGCTDDVECPPEQYCNGTICVPDVCVPGETSCQGQDLYECQSNGGGTVLKYTCGSPAYFQSDCVDPGAGNAYCGCEDDWDCPSYTRCEANACSGSGEPPTCFLPPEPFSNVLPTQEISWGGTDADTNATGSPYEQSSQVVQSPIVANLDDDNGDGLINDLDFPEIIFSSFCGSTYTTNGVLRAIHGGGATKGGDFFASCGAGTTWHEGDALPATCSCGDAILDPTSSLAVGDLDADGVPEIVAITEGDGIAIYDNTGNLLSTTGNMTLGGANPTPAIANLDMSGLAEIIVGRHVFTLEHDVTGVLQVLDLFEGNNLHGTNGQGPASCVANLTDDARPEIAAGGSVYRFPTPPANVTKIADCTGTETLPEEVAFCAGDLITLWDGNTVNGGSLASSGNGFCAIADVLGVDQTIAPDPTNPLDDLPELIVVGNGVVFIFNGQDGTLRRTLSPSLGGRGGPPNVDDFDGDGFPELGTAYGTGYVVFDLQDPTADCPSWNTMPGDDNTSCESVNTARNPPAVTCTQDSDCSNVTAGTACNEQTSQCVCLHNSWRRATEDNSSRVTGSSVFDFNGDGAAEVVYNDECRFRIYDGLDCTVYMNEPSESRTRIEYPIVVDVDNDGNAEIVFATTNESGFCSENQNSLYNNGIEVWGDAGDYWVSARRIWNQHAYNVTNVTESGAIPLHAPEHWRQYNDREYNIFRSNPRNQGIAPDLTVEAVQISSPNGVCGQLTNQLTIVAEITNLGDLRVGPGVVIGFHGSWNNPALNEPLYADTMATPITFVLQTPLEPGASIFISVAYDALNNTPGVLPDEITVIADEGDLENECDETNNLMTIPVQAGDMDADLRVELGTPALTPVCPTVPTTVYNDGSAPASNVVVRYYAGNPSQGGGALHDELFAGPIPAGGSVMADVAVGNFPQGLEIQIWAVVDPDNLIEECNDGNNTDAANSKVQCGSVN